MEHLRGNNFICSGQFRGVEIVEPGTFQGGEIEPGTFHKSYHSKDLASKADGEGSKKDEKDGRSDIESSTDGETSSGDNEGRS